MDEGNKKFYLLRMENHFDTTINTIEEASAILHDGVDSGISKGGIIYEVARPIEKYGDIADV